MRLCNVDDCGRRHYGRGYCKKHYMHFFRHGDVRRMEERLNRTIEAARKKYPNSFIPSSRFPVVHEGVCYILLYNGDIAICDEEDYPVISGRVWGLTPKGYAAYHNVTDPTKPARVLLHRLIFPEWAQIDHKNGNTLDNRRVNLRPCTHSTNATNKKKSGQRTSRFKGVHWDPRRKKWVAQIAKDGKHYSLGRFSDEIDAARAYDVKAKELHGEFARPNFTD